MTKCISRIVIKGLFCGGIDLCGHATLATAYVLFRFYVPNAKAITFQTMSGNLVVTKKGDLLEMKFPAYALQQVPVTKAMSEALGAEPQEAYLGRDLLCVFADADIIPKLTPDLTKVKQLDGLLLHVTAPGKNVDCVSRTFAPKLNVVEDPVCGSGHCHIVPYWSKRLNKTDIVAYQASKRGGTLYCRMDNDNVFLAGKAMLFSAGTLQIAAVW